MDTMIAIMLFFTFSPCTCWLLWLLVGYCFSGKLRNSENSIQFSNS